MKLHLLWTDQCFLVVLLIVLIVLRMGWKKEHIRLSFRRIFQKPIPVASSIVLLLFLVIAVIDSLHFQTSGDNQPTSVLDRILSPLGDQYEKTYSAPLALNLYTTETVYKGGVAEQVYPRLSYPPAWLKNSRQVNHLIVKIVSFSLLYSFLGVFILWMAYGIRQRMKKGVWDFSISPPRCSTYLTVLFILFFLITTFWLSRYLHILGTGKIGQDIFYSTVKSIRTGLVIGTLTTLFMMPLALLLGISAGYFGGIIDDIIQYIYTTLSSIPGILLISASVLSMQTYIANHPEQFTTLAQTADARLLALCFILGVTSWTSLCRLLRAEALKLREIDYVLAAQALGSRPFKILFRHLLPNVMHIVVITLVLDFSFLVLAEAVLSYVGVGVSPLTISWGNMINAARLELARDPVVWWPMMAAFVFMFVLVLASNLFADAVRDALDPQQAKM